MFILIFFLEALLCQFFKFILKLVLDILNMPNEFVNLNVNFLQMAGEFLQVLIGCVFKKYFAFFCMMRNMLDQVVNLGDIALQL